MVREGAGVALGEPALVTAMDSSPRFQSFPSVYAEARCGNAVAAVGLPVPQDAAEALIWTAKVLAARYALVQAHRLWSVQTYRSDTRH